MIIDKIVKLQLTNTRQRNKYAKMGYDTSGEYIDVSYEDMPVRSEIKIKFQCDNPKCKKTFERQRRCVRQYDDGLGDLCNECTHCLRASTNRQKARQAKIAQDPNYNDKVQEKRRQTNLRKYGTEYACQNAEIIAKQKKTYLSNHTEYPFARKEIQEKIKQTMISKYGGYPMQVDEFLQKAQKTNLEKYGHICSACNDKVKNKQMNSMLQNGTVPTSSQQLAIYKILKNKYDHCILNRPLSRIFLDCEVKVNDILIDVEYDGGYWHNDRQHDRQRDEFTKSNGYKVLRNKSKRLIPTEDELINALESLSISNHTYNELILNDWNS